MKFSSKILLSILSIGFLSACATMQLVRDESLIVDQSFDIVWSAATEALSKAGFRIRSIEKDSGVIVATAGRNAFIHNQAPEINFLVIENKATQQVTIRASVIQAGQLIDYGMSSKNLAHYVRPSIWSKWQSYGW